MLWDKNVETVEVNKTYLFTNLKMKVSKYERYLNTPWSEPFEETEGTPFNTRTPLVQFEQDVSTTLTVKGNIIGIHKASKSLCCLSCKRCNIVVTSGKACKLIQLVLLPAVTPCPRFLVRTHAPTSLNHVL